MKLNGSFYLVLGCAQVASSAVLPVFFPKNPSEEAPDVKSIYPTLESETSSQSPPLVKKLYAEIMLLRAPRPLLEAPSSKSFTLPPLSKHRIPRPKSHPLSDPDRKEVGGEGNFNVWGEENTGESSVEGEEDGRTVQLIDVIMASSPAPPPSPASSSTVWPLRPACMSGVLPSDRNETLLVYLALAFVVTVVVCETLREAVGR